MARKRNSFAAWIEANKKSMLDIANELGVDRSYVSLLASGKRIPAVGLAVKIFKLTKGAVLIESWADDS